MSQIESAAVAGHRDGAGAARPAVNYMPQLDSLRALAALGVFMQHFLAEDNLFRSTLPMGDLGVRLFFVLSGFLITGLLLQGRDQIERGVASGTTVARNFFARRALRLFPIYFLVVALSLAALPGLRADAAWYLFYAQNILYALRDGFVYGDHLWTLAVEEQFYLVWPLVVLATPRRWLGPVVVVLILAGPAFRIACLGLGMSHFQASMLTPAHIDTLGIGALLALLAQRFGLDDPQLRRLLVGSAVAGFTVLLGVLAAKVAGLPSWIELLGGEFGAALLFVWLIGAAAQGFTGPLGWLLSLPFLVYLGRISYGMYLYHWFLPDLLGALGIRLAGGEWPVFVQLTLLSIAIAALSWHVLEKPANGLKRHFELREQPAS